MHISNSLLLYILTVLSSLGHVATAKPSNSVLLTNVKTLTLRKDKLTSARRVAAIPQLQCIGGSGKGLYEVDVMRCINQGTDYEDDNVQWTCTASLPAEFKLGSTDVVCEGYSSPSDPYILKGSCGVEYRLVLTEAGEAKYGRRGDGWGSDLHLKSKFSSLVESVFWLLFVGVFAYIVVAFVRSCLGRNGRTGPRQPRPFPWGGGAPGDDDPPPPYDAGFPPKPRYSAPRASSSRSSSSGQREGWRPGFWTGTAAGAAAGYMAGRGNRGTQTNQIPQRQEGSGWFSRNTASGAPSSSYSAPGPSSARHESTGFGGTRRR